MQPNQTNSKYKKSPNWGKIGAIATIIAVIVAIVVAIIELWPPKTDPHESILNSITEIRKSFLPSEIHSELDSNVFVNTYKEFQTNVLDVCDYWVDMENKLSHYEPANPDVLSVSSCRGRLESYQMGSKAMNDRMKETVMYIGSLYVVAELSYEQSNLINIDECDYLKKLLDVKEKTMTEYLTRASKYIEKGKLEKSMMEIDKMKKDKDYLEFDEKFFDYCIQVKGCCDRIMKEKGI